MKKLTTSLLLGLVFGFLFFSGEAMARGGYSRSVPLVPLRDIPGESRGAFLANATEASFLIGVVLMGGTALVLRAKKNSLLARRFFLFGWAMATVPSALAMGAPLVKNVYQGSKKICDILVFGPLRWEELLWSSAEVLFCFLLAALLLAAIIVFFHLARVYADLAKKEIEKVIALAITFLFLALPVITTAEEVETEMEKEKSDFSFSVSSDIKNRCIDPAGWVFNSPIVGTTVGVEWKNFYFQVFHLTGINDHEWDELDWSVGYLGESDLFQTEKKINWEIGLSVYDPKDFFKNSSGEDFLDVFAKVGVPFAPEGCPLKSNFAPYVKVELLTPFEETEGIGGGTYIWLGLEHSAELGEHCSLTQDLALLFDSGVYGGDSGQLLRYTGQLSWPVGEILKINIPIVEFVIPLSHFDEERDGRSNEIAFGAGISFVF